MKPSMRPSKSVLRQDATAGLINAVVSVPDGLASAALAGVNPVFGLYTSIAAPIGGSLLASTQLMQVSTTSASALAAAQAIAAYPETKRAEAMFLLVVLTGFGLLVFGLLRLGRNVPRRGGRMRARSTIPSRWLASTIHPTWLAPSTRTTACCER